MKKTLLAVREMEIEKLNNGRFLIVKNQEEIAFVESLPKAVMVLLEKTGLKPSPLEAGISGRGKLKITLSYQTEQP